MQKIVRISKNSSSVDERGNIETDKDYYFQRVKQEPGWQTKFQENFAGINTEEQTRGGRPY